MELQIALFVVGLLEEDVGADAGFLQQAVIVNGRCRDVDVDAADGSVLMFDAVDRFDGFQIIIHCISDRIFAGFKGEALVSHILQGDDFPTDVFLRELLPRDVFILRVVRAVGAPVDAVVGQVERREHDDPVAVEVFFDLFRQLTDLLILFLDGTGQQDGSLPVGESFALLRLLDDGIDQFDIFFVFVCVGERLKDLFVIDKIVCAF